MKKPIRKRKNPSVKQISFDEREFYNVAGRGNSYKKTLLLLDALKKNLERRYQHLVFKDPKKIFTVEEALTLILEGLE